METWRVVAALRGLAQALEDDDREARACWYAGRQGKNKEANEHARRAQAARKLAEEYRKLLVGRLP